MGGCAETIAEHAKEMLAVELRFFGYGVEREWGSIVRVDPFAGLGKSFEQFDAGGAPGDGQSSGCGFCGEGLAGQIQQDLADHSISFEGTERAAAVAKADQPLEAVLQDGIHGVSALEPAKIGMVFGQRFMDGVGPEEEEERLYFGAGPAFAEASAGEADGQAAALVDDEVSGRVEGDRFVVDRKPACSGYHGKDAGAGDMLGEDIGFSDRFHQEGMIGKVECRAGGLGVRSKEFPGDHRLYFQSYGFARDGVETHGDFIFVI